MVVEEGVKVPHLRASAEFTRHPTPNRPSSLTVTPRRPATGTEGGRAVVEGRAAAAGAAAGAAAAAVAGVVVGAGAVNRKIMTSLYLHTERELRRLSRKITESGYRLQNNLL